MTTSRQGLVCVTVSILTSLSLAVGALYLIARTGVGGDGAIALGPLIAGAGIGTLYLTTTYYERRNRDKKGAR